MNSCRYCGNKFQVLGSGVYLNIDVGDIILRTRKGCDACGVAVCFDCAADAADKKGLHGHCVCPNCGANLDDKREKDIRKQLPVSRTCPKCSAMLAEEPQAVCPKCGAFLDLGAYAAVLTSANDDRVKVLLSKFQDPFAFKRESAIEEVVLSRLSDQRIIDALEILATSDENASIRKLSRRALDALRQESENAAQINEQVATVEESSKIEPFTDDSAAKIEIEKCTCDVCNATTSREQGTTYTATEFRQLVSKGFEPDESATFITMMTMFGISRQQAIAQWKQGLVAQSTTDWCLCPSCASRAAKYMPKKAGTGPITEKQTEPITPEMLRPAIYSQGSMKAESTQPIPSSGLEAKKKWWQFWK